MGLANKLHVRIVALRKIFRQYPMILPFSPIIRDTKKAPGPKWHLNSDIVTAITKSLLIINRRGGYIMCYLQKGVLHPV